MAAVEGRIVNCGGLGWSGEVFWRSTLAEFHYARAEQDQETAEITQADARRVALAQGYALFGE